MAKRRRSSGSSPARSSSVAELRRGGVGGGGAGGSRPKRDLRYWWESFKSIAGAIIIFLLIRAFLIEAYRIPSPSMVPALLPGDWLFVDKVRYGPKVPFLSWHLPGYAEPRRWDVAVFKSPLQIDQPWDPTPTLVKRIVGMPGDTIHSRGGVVHINGIPQRQGYASGSIASAVDATHPLFAWQHEHEVKGTRFGEPPAEPRLDHWGPLVVPPRRYFMMGDNRYESKDSRFWGLVPRENFRGRPLFVYYSYDTECPRALCPLTAIRWGRIGEGIR